MRSPLSYQLTIWPPVLIAFLMSIGYGSRYALLFALMQIGLFYLATRNLFRREIQTNRTSVVSWLCLAAVAALTCWLSAVCWLFRDLSV